MASIPPHSKRRRIEQAASTLSKPFRSPLRRPPPSAAPEVEAQNAGAARQRQEATCPSPNADAEPQAGTDTDRRARGSTFTIHGMHPLARRSSLAASSPSSGVGVGVTKGSASAEPTQIENRLHSTGPTTTAAAAVEEATINDDSPAPTRIRIAGSLHGKLPAAAAAAVGSSVVLDLQKQQRRLQAQLAALRSQLDTAQQALRIESSTKDDELEGLIRKWKAVSQDAADEVFVGARERALRMGGVRAWKERGWLGGGQGRNGDGWWDSEVGTRIENKAGMKLELSAAAAAAAELEASGEWSWVDEDFDEDGDEEGNGQIGFSGARGTGREEKEDGKDEDEEESFTMGMMLRMLNIDPKIIGFDQTNQRWLKDS